MASFNALARASMASAGRAPTYARRVVSTAPARRFSSSEAAEAAKPSPPPPPQPKPKPEPPAAETGGSSLLQRLTAFLTGAGLGCGVGYYHLAAEIKGSTAALEKAIAKNHSDLNDRLAKLEGRSE